MEKKELENGLIETKHEFICLFCGKAFNKEEIFPLGQHLATAKGAIRQHVETKHGGSLKALLELPSEITGLSETQKKIMLLLGLDLSDQEIADQLNITKSTIRNHRFKLKEKKKQAQYFIAIMNLLEEKNKKMQIEEISIHNYDERFDIKEKEKQKVLQTFLNAEGKLTTIPRKAKSKIILLQHISGLFSSEKTYSEKEVNQIIQTIYADFVTLRRYLIEYGFFARTNDGEKYWKI
ncbi:MAG TPA: DUF2087 domain-containing protein [Tetragenococcus sp.]|nr:DUF2087 domain-containing protein [Tetragenococcus sp.]